MRLTPVQREDLQRWLRSTTLPAGLARRARLLLLLEQPDTSLRQAGQSLLRQLGGVLTLERTEDGAIILRVARAAIT